MTARLTRRRFLICGASAGAAALAVPAFDLLRASASEIPGLLVEGPPSALAGIYELQAAFHLAKTNQDLDLMASIWAEDATLHANGQVFSGRASIKTFFSTSGSFTHHRISLVPSFRDKIQVRGDEAFMYFECHDVDKATGMFAAHLNLFGTVQKVEDRWLFADMTAGTSVL